MIDDSVQIVPLPATLALPEVATHLQVCQRERDVATDLGREVCVEFEPLQVNTQDIRQLDNTRLLPAVLETGKGMSDKLYSRNSLLLCTYMYNDRKLGFL